MSRELPEWQPYDPASSPLPDIRGSNSDARGGAVIVLLEAPGVREEGWGAHAAASLASKLARAGRRVFLADLDVVRPSLHRVLGVSNDEGVSDAFVYGASIQRVAQPVDDGRYFFAPAGTVLGSPAAVASSGRWDPVLEGFRTARADVVLLVPSDQDGVERILDRATDVVLLGGPDESVDGSLGPDRVRAVLGPAPSAGAPAPPSAVAPRPEAFPEVPPPPGVRDHGDEDPSVVPAATTRGRTPRRTAEKARPSPVRLALLLLLLLASLAVAWWLGVFEIPGVARPAGDARVRDEGRRGLDIPAHVLEVPTAPGAAGRAVYAGDLPDGAEAAPPHRQPAERGIAAAVLTERAGGAPAAPSPE